MAKSKAQRHGPGILNKVMASLHKPKTDDRLGILAIELGLAGGEVLQRDFGFTQEQTAKWLDAMLDQIKFNRVRNTAYLAVQQIDDPARGQSDKARSR